MVVAEVELQSSYCPSRVGCTTGEVMRLQLFKTAVTLTLSHKFYFILAVHQLVFIIERAKIKSMKIVFVIIFFGQLFAYLYL